MAVDKNLFLYDLAVVAIMKNEAPYVKEWLDYHLAAGVNHFYIYDNESPDNLKEVLQPYIDAGIVTYKFYPGTSRQVEAYTEAFKTYRFFCRYIAFIDADEFIFPQTKETISEFVDNSTKNLTNFGGLGISWMMYGSNNLEKADYSKGVLERFTRRAKNSVEKVKTIANPRRINYMFTPHYAFYFNGYDTFYESILVKSLGVSERILINHYKLKSREEYYQKISQGSKDASYGSNDYYRKNKFKHSENNKVFDDSILDYRDCCTKNFIPKKIDYEKLVKTLMKNLSPMFNKNVTLDFFEGKMETFLTCLALITHLKGNLIDEERAKILENAVLTAIHNTMLTNISVADVEMLLSEMTNILKLNYPAVENIRRACIEFIPQIKDVARSYIDGEEKIFGWFYFFKLEDLSETLKIFDEYNHN